MVGRMIRYRALAMLLCCLVLTMILASCSGGGGSESPGGGSPPPAPPPPSTALVTGRAHAGTPARPLAQASCRFVDLQDRRELARATTDRVGVFELHIPLEQQGFILCHPAALASLELAAFMSTLGQAAGGRLSNADVTPASTVIADVIRANDPTDPQARKEALLAALDRREADITALVEASTLAYQTLFDAQIESDATFAGDVGSESDGAEADGGGAEGEAGDGGEFSPLPEALCTFSLDAAGLVRANTVLADLYADGQIDRLDLQTVSAPINNAFDAERRRAITRAFTALFPIGIGPALATIADGANSTTPGHYFLPIPAGVPGVVTCTPVDLDHLVLRTCVRARVPNEVLTVEDVTPISTVVCEFANEAQQAGNTTDRETTKLDLFGRLAPLRIFLSEDRNGNGVQDADEADKNGDGEFATIVELETDAPLTENNRDLALLASMSTTIFDTMRIERDSLALAPSFAEARDDFFTDGVFELPLETLAFGVEGALNDPENQVVLGTNDVVTAAKTGTLQGRVTDAQGRPVSDVQVVVSQGNVEVAVPDNPATTDVDGRFRIRAIPVGDTTVRAFLGEFEVLRVTTNVVAVVTVTLEIAPTPKLEPRPTALVFGEVEVGSGRVLTVRLANTGTADLTIDGLVIEGADAAAFGFRQRPVLPVIVSAGSEVTVDVGYEPADANAALATLRVESNAIHAEALALPLIGTGVARPVPQIELSRTSFAFGEVELNAFRSQSMVVSNSGTAPLTVRAVTIEAAAESGFILEQVPALPAMLPADGELALRVRFQPTRAGVSRGIVRIQSDADATPSRTVALSGTGVVAPVPEMSATPGVLEFGEVQVNVPGEAEVQVTQTVTLHNTGTANLTLTAIRVDSSQGNEFRLFRPPSLPVTLIPGAGLALDVQYRPTLVGSVTGAVRIRSDAVNLDDLIIALNGTGVDTSVPKIAASVATLDYGEVEIGSTRQLPVDVTNTGTGDLDITGLTIPSSEGREFQLSRPPETPFTLVPGATQRLHVQFRPGVQGYMTGALRILNNDVEQPSHLISLRGEGVSVPIPQMNVSPAVASFGEVEVGFSRTLVVTISNPGRAELEITAFEGSVLSAEDFALRRLPQLPVPVRPGAEVDIEVVFQPRRAGSVTGTLQIRGTAPEAPVFIIPLHGTATSEPLPKMQVHPQTLDFGEVQASTTQTDIVTIQNHGTANLVIRSLSVTDQSSGDFEIDNAPQLPVTVVPESTAQVRMRYSPSAPGVASGVLRIVGNDPDIPTATVSLNGIGTQESAAQIDVTPDALAFAEVQEGRSRILTLTIHNPGTATLHLTDLVIDGAAFRLADASDVPIPIQPQGVVRLDVVYEPTASGADTGTLRLVNNSPATPEVIVALSGRAVPEPKPRIEVNPQLVAFADVQIGSQRRVPIDILNTGTAALQVTELRVDGGPSGTFTLDGNPAPVTVVEGGSIRVHVNFAPDTAGSVTGTFYAESDADNVDGIRVPLSGTGLAEPTPQIDVAPAIVEFPAVEVGASRVETITIRNTGTDDLIITALDIDGGEQNEFQVSGAPTLPVTVLPEGAVEVRLAYAPVTIGAASGTLTIASNDPQTPALILPINGVGAPLPMPQVMANTSTLSFSEVEIGRTRQRTVTVTNMSNATLTIREINVQSEADGVFALADGLAVAGISAGEILVAPQAELSIDIVFAPQAAGLVTGTLQLLSDAANAAVLTVPLNGVGTEAPMPALAASPAMMDFGALDIGQTRLLTVSMRNEGTADLRIETLELIAADATSFQLGTIPELPAVVPPDNTVAAEIRFVPRTAGSATGTFRIVSNDPDRPETVLSVSGEALSTPTAQLTVSPSPMRFGAVPVATAATMTLSMTNAGSVNLEVTALTVNGGPNNVFRLGGGRQAPFSVAPGGVETLDIVFAPSAAGAVTGSVDIRSNASNAPDTRVELSGTGTAPQISVDPTTVAFGDVVLEQDVVMPITITNVGTADLQISSATVEGDAFSLSGEPLGTPTLRPGAFLTVGVRFNPRAVGEAAGSLQIVSNAPGSPTSIPLRGNGLPIPVLIEITPDALAFGTVFLGDSEAMVLTIRNPGASVLRVSGVRVSGGADAGFALGEPFAGPVDVVPGGEFTVTAMFAPVAAGAVSGAIEILSNAANSPQALVSMSGRGAASPTTQIGVSLEQLDFAEVTLNDTQTRELTLRNEGSIPLTVRELALTTGGDLGFALVDGPSEAFAIVPGGSFVVVVSFTPLRAGPAEGHLRVTSDAENNPALDVPLRGTGVAQPTAMIDVKPSAAVDFGNVEVAQTRSATMTMSNTGNADLTLARVSVPEGADAGFAIAGTPIENVVLAPDNTLEVTVTFRPVVEGLVTGLVRVESDAENVPVLERPLRGMGTAVPLPVMTVTPGQVVFAAVEVGVQATQEVRIENAGDANLTVTEVQIAAGAASGFSVTGAPSALRVLAPGEMLQVTVGYAPVAAGPVTGTLSVLSDASNGAERLVPLQGTGVNPPAPGLEVTPRTLNFGGVPLGQDATLSFAISNPGNAVLELSGALASSAGDGVFTLGNVPPAIAASGEALVPVTFRPSGVGAASATVRITSNAVPGEITVEVAGRGVGVPQLGVSASSLDFGAVQLGAASMESVRLENTGTGTLQLGAVAIRGNAAFTLDTAVGNGRLEPGAVLTLEIAYRPTTVGESIATLEIPSNAANGTPQTTVALRGEGVVAMIDVQPSSLSFDPQEIGRSQTLSVQVVNGGTGTLDLTSVSIDEPSFVLGAVPASVAPGGTETVEVIFMPDRGGDILGELTIDNNSENAPQVVVELSGMGTVPAGAGVLVRPTVLTFGDTAIDETMALSVTVRSVGLANVTLSRLELGSVGSFVLGGLSVLPMTLAPGETATVEIIFIPTVLGPFSELLRIESNDENDPVINVPLNGVGVEAMAVPGVQAQ